MFFWRYLWDCVSIFPLILLGLQFGHIRLFRVFQRGYVDSAMTYVSLDVELSPRAARGRISLCSRSAVWRDF